MSIAIINKFNNEQNNYKGVKHNKINIYILKINNHIK
jgi:hypothetical protein